MRRTGTIFRGVLLASVLLAAAAHAGLEMYAIHSDHLGTPRVITDKDQRVVWRGNPRPFGRMEVELEEITHHQRFPGQRFDIESGRHYNYFRDYDPSLGRYIQSDPIGLQGGLNTYGYADQNPISWIDLFGLAPGQGGRGRPSFAPYSGPSNEQTFNFQMGTTVFSWDQRGSLDTYQSGAVGVGAFIEFCPPRDEPCEAPEENQGLVPDGVTGAKLGVGATLYAGGRMCFSIGPALTVVPAGPVYDTHP